jgi:hypothetical protein
VHTIHETALAVGLSAACAAGMTTQAQETKTTTTTRVEITGGRDVTVTGCLGRSPNGDYMLTGAIESRRLAPSQYALVTDDDLSKHVGERVEIKGKAVANGSGKVSVETTTKTEVPRGRDQETTTKTEGTRGTFAMAVLGLKSMKTLSASCY